MKARCVVSLALIVILGVQLVCAASREEAMVETQQTVTRAQAETTMWMAEMHSAMMSIEMLVPYGSFEPAMLRNPTVTSQCTALAPTFASQGGCTVLLNPNAVRRLQGQRRARAAGAKRKRRCKPALQFRLRVRGDIKTLPKRSPARAQFKANVAQDLARAAQVPPAHIRIVRLSRGGRQSVRIYGRYNGPYPRRVAFSLSNKARNPSSRLLRHAFQWDTASFKERFVAKKCARKRARVSPIVPRPPPRPAGPKKARKASKKRANKKRAPRPAAKKRANKKSAKKQKKNQKNNKRPTLKSLTRVLKGK